MKKLIEMISWFLVSIGSINWGLDAMGYNLFYTRIFMMMPAVITPLKYLIGIAGIISLVLFFMKVSEK